MPEPAVDLDYDLEEDKGLFTGWLFKGLCRAHLFFFDRVREAVVETTGDGPPGRVLDVGSGLAYEAALFLRRGWESWGLEPSLAMLARARVNLEEMQAGVTLVRGIGESLPFRDATFDRVLCQGSLDHFADPQAFVVELARILKPEGRAVIALTNYESLSCRLGRTFFDIRRSLGLPYPPPEYRYWEPPPTHTFKGGYRSVTRLGAPWLEMERCFGVSLLWLLPRWTQIVERMPDRLAQAVLRALDRIAYRVPALADMIISTWRPRGC